MAGVGGEILGYNQFIYCFNNPVNLYDDMGTWPKWNTLVKGALLLTIGVLAVSAVVVAPVTCSMVVGLGYAAVATAGTVTAAMGASEVYESFTDENPIRNAIGDTAYDLVKSASLTVISAGPAVIEAGTSPQSTSVCFVAGTLVLTDDGQVSIEKIQIGDYVWASNPETGETSLKKVVQTFVNETDELVHLTINGEIITCTNEHPFYSPIKGWTSACQLRAGDILVTVNGNLVIVEQIQHELLEFSITVYNFEVEDFHTYYVGNSFILVHNSCDNEPSRGVGGKGWVGDRTWKSNVNTVNQGGTITEINGVIPTKAEALKLIAEANGVVERIDIAHDLYIHILIILPTMG